MANLTFEHALRLWANWSWEQLIDSSFWLGALTLLLFIMGALVSAAFIPAIRGAVAPLTNFAARLGNGYYYFLKKAYPDIISATVVSLVRLMDGQVVFMVDSTFSERLLLAVVINPYKAYLIRQTAFREGMINGLIRLNNHGPKRRHWWQRWLPKRSFAIQKQRLNRRYRSMYSALVAAIAQHWTNDAALEASRGRPGLLLPVIIAKTFTGEEERHHRLLKWHWRPELWPTEPPALLEQGLAWRYHLTRRLQEKFLQQPWRFAVLYDFVPAHKVTPEDVATFNAWLAHCQRSRFLRTHCVGLHPIVPMPAKQAA